MNEKVSIVTVCYNSENTIKDTIESVLNQTYTNIEYIIVDGLSNDTTVKIIKSYESKFLEKGIKYEWISERDNGIYDAMNKGIIKSTGDIVGIINSDDWYEKDAIEKVVIKYNQDNFDMVYGDLRIIGKNKNYIKKAKLKKIISTRYWNHPTTFIKRKVYEKNFYKLESINDDLDLMLKIRKNKNLKVVVINEILANFRLGGVSNIKSLKRAIKSIKNRNNIYKNNGYSKLYYLDNFIIEMIKYFLG